MSYDDNANEDFQDRGFNIEKKVKVDQMNNMNTQDIRQGSFREKERKTNYIGLQEQQQSRTWQKGVKQKWQQDTDTTLMKHLGCRYPAKTALQQG